MCVWIQVPKEGKPFIWPEAFGVTRNLFQEWSVIQALDGGFFPLVRSKCYHYAGL